MSSCRWLLLLNLNTLWPSIFVMSFYVRRAKRVGKKMMYFSMCEERWRVL